MNIEFSDAYQRHLVRERIIIRDSNEIRQEYNNWKYSDAEQRFQRVYRIIKLKQS